MQNSTRVYRFSRRLPLLLFGLAGIFAITPFIPNRRDVLPLGYLLMAVLPVAIATLGVLAWRNVVRVNGTNIQAGALVKKSYRLSSTSSIDVRRDKGGRTATIRFFDDRNLTIDGGLVGFDDLLALISERTGLPVSEPIWDP